MTKGSSGFSVCDEDRADILSIRVSELDSADEFRDDTDAAPGIAQHLMPGGAEMTQDEFAEFWGIGAWNTIADVGPMINRDLRPCRVGDDRKEQALIAGAALYKATGRYPKVFGWMRSPATALTGEIGACVTFFGTQLMTLALCVQRPVGIQEREANVEQ